MDHHHHHLLFPISQPPPTLCTSTASVAPSWAFSWKPQAQEASRSLAMREEELKQALLRTTLELESTRAAAQAELQRMEGQALQFACLLEAATRERDEARLQCRSLLHLLMDQQQHRFLPTITSAGPSSNSNSDAPTHQQLVLHEGSNVSESEEEEGSDGSSSAAERRGLPEKGRLVEAVMGAGPLLQTLLLAGPLPEWRHPPPAMQSFEIPPVGIHSGSLKWERQEELGFCAVGSASPSSSALPPPSPSSSSPETNGNSKRIANSMLM